MSFKNISELFLRKRIISKAALDYFKEKENSKSLSSNLFQKRKIPITSLREAIKKKVNIFGLCQKEGGSRTKPTFLHKDNLGCNFKGRGG